MVRVKISPIIAVFPVPLPELLLASLPLRLRMPRGRAPSAHQRGARVDVIPSCTAVPTRGPLCWR
jgi:hypothetical protein